VTIDSCGNWGERTDVAGTPVLDGDGRGDNPNENPEEGNGKPLLLSAERTSMNMNMNIQQNTTSDMELEGVALRPESSLIPTKEERREARSSTRINEATGLKPLGRLDTEDDTGNKNCSLSFRCRHNIATWNVRSMYEGKMDIVLREMKRMNIDVLGISELRWTGGGHYQSEEYKIIYSGNSTAKKTEWH
jgi:hypothetical protein